VAFLDQQGAVALWRPGEPQPLSVIADLGTNNSALATAPARGLLACSTPQGSVRVWSLKSASLLTNLPPGRVRGLGFSKREDVLVAVSAPGLVSIWDASTWTTRCSFAETNYATTPAFSPDGRLLVLGREGGKVEWWDAVRGRLLAQTPGHHSGVACLDFSPDGRILASCSDDGTVALWDVRARRRTHLWRADRGSTAAVAFSPDGTRLATGSASGDECVARLWDLRTKRQLLSLAGPGGWFYAVKFSPEGDALLCLDHTGENCYQWRVPSFAELDGAR
jgi:WD40 repeat protein